jgi:hypothetical protein
LLGDRSSVKQTGEKPETKIEVGVSKKKKNEKW